MITLGKKEKILLKDIVELSKKTQNMFLGNILDKHLDNIEIYLDYENKKVQFRFDKEVFPATTDFFDLIREMSWDFMKLARLLQYLEKNNYLYLFQETEREKNYSFGRLIDGNAYISHTLYDPDITQLLIDISHRTIVTGQTLIDYVENDFKTDEQLRHEDNLEIAKQSLAKSDIGLSQSKKSIKRATTAIIVSIILGIISIFASFYIANKQANSETKINDDQFDILNTQFNSLNEQMKLNNIAIQEKVIPDTIKTVIVKRKK